MLAFFEGTNKFNIPNPPPHGHTKLFEKDITLMKQMLNMGWTKSALAEYFKVDRKTIYNHLNK